MKLRVLVVSMLAAFGLCTGTALAGGDPIMPLPDVQPGMNCTAYTVVQGTTITSFQVQVVDVIQDPQFGQRILVNVSGPAVNTTGIAEGMSGSPVYCPMSDGSMAVAGALSAGIPFTTQGEVTPIQQMLGEAVLPPVASARDTSRAPSTHAISRMRSLAGPLTIGGLSPALLHLVQHAAASSGRIVVAQPQGASDSAFPVQPLIPGAAVAVSYSTGAIPMGAVGTVTYASGQDIYAFGHELDGAGRRSLILQDAFVDGISTSPLSGAFKLAAPGHTLGTLTADTPDAVIGVLGAPPRLVPVDVRAHDLDTGRTILLSSQVADETDVGLPLGASIVDAVAPLEAGQAATQVFNGPPAFESGRMCVQIWLREARTPLGFCNRYLGAGAPGDLAQPPALAGSVFSDMNTAFSLIEQEGFAKLHVNRVSAQIDAQRGLMEASLVSASAPARVRPGQLVTVRLLVRRFRGATQTIAFRLRIPRHVHGMYTAVLHGPPPVLPTGSGPLGAGMSGGVGAVFGSSGEGPGGTPPASSSTLAQLRAEISQITNYDGLNLPAYSGLTLSTPGRPGAHVYLDPSLLITGSAPLAFVVR